MKERKKLKSVIVRFAGDSGDGIQLLGSQFTRATAIFGNDFEVYPDFPAEIRAPAGTVPGVSAFQIQFSSVDIHTPGDFPDVLVAFNPAALKANLELMKKSQSNIRIIILNIDEFNEINYKKAHWEELATGEKTLDEILKEFKVYKIPITTLTINALKDINVPHKDKERAKNFFALGLTCWMFGRSIDPILKFIEKKFSKKPIIKELNEKALRAGYNYGETLEIEEIFEVPRMKLGPGKYRYISGNEAIALGIITAKIKTGIPVVYASYPITPASDILHFLAEHKGFGVITLQMEDEIASINAAVGAAFAGAIGITGTSGPGLALKTEGINLAVMTELPVIIIDNQRAGPSTGMPTKTEQGDLFAALMGRPGESPLIVISPITPSDCFYAVLDAVKLAIKYMTPVIILSDTYLANGSEPWKIPNLDEIPEIKVDFSKPEKFFPYIRNENLARPWVKPGTPGGEHRIGGLEKSHITGKVSYDPENHDLMVKLRAEKIQKAQEDIPDVEVFGPQRGELLILGWGSTFGVIREVVEEAIDMGLSVAHAQLRYLNPLPKNLGEILKRYEKVLIPEINLGQLRLIIRGKYLINAIGFNRVTGQPIRKAELWEEVRKILRKGGERKYVYQ